MKNAGSFNAQRRLLDEKVQELQEQKFYGRVTLEICSGNIVQVKLEKSWKLKEEADGIASKEAQADGRSNQEAPARSKHPN